MFSCWGRNQASMASILTVSANILAPDRMMTGRGVGNSGGPPEQAWEATTTETSAKVVPKDLARVPLKRKAFDFMGFLPYSSSFLANATLNPDRPLWGSNRES